MTLNINKEKWIPRLWFVGIFSVWGLISINGNIVHTENYGFDESAAHGLLLVWSISERVVSSIFVLGLPDLRALLMVPLGVYWAGSVLAAKVFSLIVSYIGVALSYYWFKKSISSEAALLGGGLLLISPVLLSQTDALAAGPFLILLFAIGWYLDQKFRAQEHALNGKYFTQLLVMLIVVSIHPIGLAYPCALIWGWYDQPTDKRRQRHVFIGTGISVTLSMLLIMGWDAQSWLENPFKVVIQALTGNEIPEDGDWLIAIIFLTLWIALLIYNFKFLVSNMLGRIVLFASNIGIICADASWVLIGLLVLLFFGSHHLIRINQSFKKSGFLGSRGLALLVIFILATIFMQMNKAQSVRALSEQDQVILRLATEIEDITAEKEINIISEWPARTMLATRRATFPLPPKFSDALTLSEKIKGTTHIIFDHNNAKNKVFRDQISSLTHQMKTLDVRNGGVIVEVVNIPDDASPDNLKKNILTPAEQ